MASLYQLRKAKGLTQQEIAEKLNVAQGCVSHWENGYNRPTVKYWEPLAKVLGVTVEEIRDCLPGHPPLPNGSTKSERKEKCTMKSEKKLENALDLLKQVKELEQNPYVRLAQLEEVVRFDLRNRLEELRELEKRGRFLYAGGLRMEDLQEEEAEL